LHDDVCLTTGRRYLQSLIADGWLVAARDAGPISEPENRDSTLDCEGMLFLEMLILLDRISGPENRTPLFLEMLYKPPPSPSQCIPNAG
jgi:hypothetical protein